MALLWTYISTSLLYWIVQHWPQHWRCVSPGLSGGEGSPSSACWECSAQEAIGLCIAGSWSIWCLPGPPGPSLQSCFPADQLPVCTKAQGYSPIGAFPFCWTPWCSCESISPALWGPSEWQCNHPDHPVYQPLLPSFVLYVPCKTVYWVWWESVGLKESHKILL